MDIDSDDNNESITKEYLEPNVATGTFTGVALTTQGQLQRRRNCWKAPPATVVVDDDDAPTQAAWSTNKPALRTIALYAVKKALEMQTSGEIRITNARSMNAAKFCVPDAYVVENAFGPGWACRPPRGEQYG